MMKLVYTNLIIFVGILIYFLFPVSIDPTVSIKQEKKINLQENPQSSTSSYSIKNPLAFSLDAWSGYINAENFSIYTKIPSQHFGSYSNTFYYDMRDKTTKNYAGKSIYTSSMIPNFTENGQYEVYLSSGTVIQLDQKHDPLWNYSYSSYLTSFADSENYVLLGYLDGSISLINREGEIIYHYTTDGSQVLATYGVGISDDEQYFVAITGLNPQRFLLFQKNKTSFQPDAIYSLENEQRSPVKINYHPTQNSISFRLENVLYLYSIDKKIWGQFDLPKNTKNLEIIDIDGYLIYLTKTPEHNFLFLLSSQFLPLSQMELPPSESILLKQMKDSYFLIGTGNTLTQFSLNRE